MVHVFMLIFDARRRRRRLLLITLLLLTHPMSTAWNFAIIELPFAFAMFHANDARNA